MCCSDHANRSLGSHRGNGFLFSSLPSCNRTTYTCSICIIETVQYLEAIVNRYGNAVRADHLATSLQESRRACIADLAEQCGLGTLEEVDAGRQLILRVHREG